MKVPIIITSKSSQVDVCSVLPKLCEVSKCSYFWHVELLFKWFPNMPRGSCQFCHPPRGSFMVHKEIIQWTWSCVFDLPQGGSFIFLMSARWTLDAGVAWMDCALLCSARIVFSYWPQGRSLCDPCYIFWSSRCWLSRCVCLFCEACLLPSCEMCCPAHLSYNFAFCFSTRKSLQAPRVGLLSFM